MRGDLLATNVLCCRRASLDGRRLLRVWLRNQWAIYMVRHARNNATSPLDPARAAIWVSDAEAADYWRAVRGALEIVNRGRGCGV